MLPRRWEGDSETHTDALGQRHTRASSEAITDRRAAGCPLLPCRGATSFGSSSLSSPRERFVVRSAELGPNGPIPDLGAIGRGSLNEALQVPELSSAALPREHSVRAMRASVGLLARGCHLVRLGAEGPAMVGSGDPNANSAFATMPAMTHAIGLSQRPAGADGVVGFRV